MKFSSFKYLFKQGLHNFKGNRLMSVASVGVVSSCLILVGVCASLALNVNSFVRYLGDQNEIVVYILDSATETDVDNMRSQLDSDDNISAYTYISKDEALAEQMEYLGQYSSVLSGYQGENNPLPASFRIHIKDLTKLSQISLKLSSMSGVDYVSTPTELAGVLITLKNTTYYAGLAILIILFMVSMVVISNTIRLTVFARRREISIMKYVGATNGFIQMPFVVEGLIIGTVSAVITFVVISGGYCYLYQYITSHAAGGFASTISRCIIPYKKLRFAIGGGFLGFGWFIGGVGSALSMRRYLKV